MFKYDEFYNHLFDSEKFLSLLDNFHSQNWNKMNKQERIKLVNSFIKLYCEVLKIDKIPVHISDYKFAGFGGYLNQSSGMVIAESNFSSKNFNPYMLLDCLYHEPRHNFQDRAINNRLSEFEFCDEQQVKKWKINLEHNLDKESNYVQSSEDPLFYMCQPIEYDAYTTSISLVKKSAKILEDRLGKDPGFEEYCRQRFGDILLLYSNDKYYKKLRESYFEQIEKRFVQNKVNVELKDECLRVAKDILDKKVDELTFDEIASLFCTYVWCQIDNDKKLAILNRCLKLEGVDKNYKIKRGIDEEFDIDGIMVPCDDIVNIIEEIYHSKWYYVSDDIVAGKIECDDKLKEELSVNLIEDKHEYVNFVDCRDNSFMYRIQPYGFYNCKLVYEKLKKIKSIIDDKYQIDDKNYNIEIDNFDNEKFIKWVEKFYNKPFEEVYNENLEMMKENMQSYLNKRK